MKNAAQMKEATLEDIPRNIILHHLQSFQNNDLEAVIGDYTDESILITQDATYTGPEEIRNFFAGLMIHFPKQKSTFKLDKVIVKNELVYIVWRANTPTLDVSLGTDTFIIKDDKIYQQTFAGQMIFL